MQWLNKVGYLFLKMSADHMYEYICKWAICVWVIPSRCVIPQNLFLPFNSSVPKSAISIFIRSSLTLWTHMHILAHRRKGQEKVQNKQVPFKEAT